MNERPLELFINLATFPSQTSPSTYMSSSARSTYCQNLVSDLYRALKSNFEYDSPTKGSTCSPASRDCSVNSPHPMNGNRDTFTSHILPQYWNGQFQNWTPNLLTVDRTLPQGWARNVYLEHRFLWSLQTKFCC